MNIEPGPDITPALAVLAFAMSRIAAKHIASETRLWCRIRGFRARSVSARPVAWAERDDTLEDVLVEVSGSFTL